MNEAANTIKCDRAIIAAFIGPAVKKKITVKNIN